MRAAPPCQFSLRRFGAWHGAVLVLAAFGAATTVAWLITREAPLASPGSIAVGVAALACVAFGVSLTRTSPVDLRWDGRVWHLGRPAGDALPGTVSVAIDLGPWMLLRFAPAPASVRPRSIWLPLQRRGLEAEWHALRCAAYSPRQPAASADDAEAGL